MSEKPMLLGSAIRYHRKAKRKSPEAVAHAAHLSPRTYYRIENDEREADAQDLDLICRELGVDVGTLLSTISDPLEIRLKLEYGARLFAVSEHDGSAKAALLVFRADDLEDARAQVVGDQFFWARRGWVRADAVLGVADASAEQAGFWVRDAAYTLRPGGYYHDAHDNDLERLDRVRHHVVHLGSHDDDVTYIETSSSGTVRKS